MFRNRGTATATTKGCLAMTFFIVWFVASWATNFYKLTECDFNEPYKCEVIHGVGVIPPFAFVTAWFSIDTA